PETKDLRQVLMAEPKRRTQNPRPKTQNSEPAARRLQVQNHQANVCSAPFPRQIAGFRVGLPPCPFGPCRQTPCLPMQRFPHRVTQFLPWVLLPALASAQSATPPTGETIELSPFVIPSESDKGYVATSSLAGSRLKT